MKDQPHTPLRNEPALIHGGGYRWPFDGLEAPTSGKRLSIEEKTGVRRSER